MGGGVAPTFEGVNVVSPAGFHRVPQTCRASDQAIAAVAARWRGSPRGPGAPGFAGPVHPVNTVDAVDRVQGLEFNWR